MPFVQCNDGISDTKSSTESLPADFELLLGQYIQQIDIINQSVSESAESLIFSGLLSFTTL